jgi:hypothetical protein
LAASEKVISSLPPTPIKSTTGSITVLGKQRRHAESTALLFHYLLESLASQYPDARLEGHVAGAPSAALV